MKGRFAAAILVALAAGSCAEEEEPAPLQLFTLYELLPGAANGERFAGIPATDAVTLPGQPIGPLSPPFAAAQTLQAATSNGLNVIASFSEGEVAAYTVSEIWVGYEEVWLQPLYVMVTGFDEDGPRPLAGAKTVFGVGAKSRFYSPFWQVFFVTVPEGTEPDAYTSAAQILSDGLPLTPGPGAFCPLSPEPIRGAAPQGAIGLVRPLTGDVVGPISSGQGWVDGEQVYFAGLGTNRFTWNATGVIDETALFVLARPGPDGALAPLGLPNIGGVGRLFSGDQAVAPGNRPRFGSLWRAHLVDVPAGAAIFVPSSLPELRAAAGGGRLPVPAIHPDIEARDDVADFALRVALDPTCFDDAARFPQDCRFLDSQAAIEANVPDWSIRRTPMLVSCPFVQFRGEPVPNP